MKVIHFALIALFFIIIVLPAKYESAACNVSNCFICEVFNTNACKYCNEGYTKTISGSCTISNCNVYNCAQCTQNSRYICQSCFAYYNKSLDGSKCTPSICNPKNCKTCERDIDLCSTCNAGYYSNFWMQCVNKCDNCELGSCQYNTVYSENRCTKCKDGYTYYSGGN